MSILLDIRNNILFVASKAIDNKIDGRELMKNLDKQLDDKLGKQSENFQRIPLTNLLLEMLEGLWEEDPKDLIARLSVLISNLKHKENANG